jgi:methionyl aminopeptidase
VRLFDRIEVKSTAQVAAMRAAGRVVGITLERVREAVRPGITLAALDALAEESIRGEGAVPSFLGYGRPPYPASICASVNDVVVHGIPNDRVLADGDLVSIDCGAILGGWHGDAAITVPVGDVDPALLAMSDACRASLDAGIAAMVDGGRLSDIGAAIESSIRSAGDYGILEDYTGHGIGTSMHMDPAVPNLGVAGRGPRLRTGVVLALEPMITAGSADTTVLDDDWSVATVDGSWAAHWEHTVAITPDGPQVLTLP